MNPIFSLKTCVVLAGLFLTAATGEAQEMPEMPKPTKEHELLKQFAGDWGFTAETVPVPGQESMKCKGKESAKMVGGFWYVSNAEGDMMGMPVTNLLTLGYSPEKKKYIGTFVCSMDGTLWQYEGAMDESGKKLTLETEGPSMMEPGKKCKFREVLELKDNDHKTFTSSMQDDKGNWVKIVTMEYVRKK